MFNRSSSLGNSGGITHRTGSNTEERYNRETTPAQMPSSSSGKSWLRKAWDWMGEHSKGIGKAAGAVASGAAAIADNTFFGGAPIVSTGLGVAKSIGGAIGDEVKGSKFGKFTKGFENNRIEDKISKANEVFQNKDLDKVSKFNQFKNLITDYRSDEKERRKNKPLHLTNPVSTVSNGHVPTGYQAASAPISTTTPEIKSVIPTGSKSSYETSWLNQQKRKNKNKNNNKNKNKNKNKPKNKNNNRSNNRNKPKNNRGRKRR